MMKKQMIAVLAGCTLALSACSADSAGTAQGADGLRSISVGMIPILPTAALAAGIDQGFFEEEGLNVELEVGQGGAALVPAVISGSMDFATGNVVSLLQAREKSLDIRMVANYTLDPDEGGHALLVQPDSGIDSPADLSGKTVAVNTLNNIGELVTRESVKKAGGDPDSVQFVEINFPDMQPALERGDIAAMWTPEPYLSIAAGTEAEVLTYPGVDALRGHHTMGFFTSGEMADSDPELVASVVRAVNKTLDYAQDHPDAVREAAPQFLGLDPELVEQVRLEEFGSDLRRERITALGELMLDHELLTDPADVQGLLQSVPQP
jgi:NitT/TauT family transport system substrate-binding protein